MTQHQVRLTSSPSEHKHQFPWPLIDEDAEKAVIKQLHTNISLYRKECIYEEFENYYGMLIGIDNCLVVNSGTTALWVLYGALGLQPGDEVLVPSYTFFATSSPMIHWGLVPIFCDANEEGNFDPQQIRLKKTNRTKAVMVTHMWGLPCDMPNIRKICDEENLLLLEDCSHAHGGQINGKHLGSWGDAAAWSLQGKKIVSAGEGGVFATRHRHFYERALFFSHFNKRCHQEISNDSTLRPYKLTGGGMNLRPSPLAIALANQQVKSLEKWNQQKQKYASLFIAMLLDIPFIRAPSFPDHHTPSWYALTMQWIPEYAPCTRDQFVDYLINELGLGSVDIPMSTCPNHVLPLFAQPQHIRPDFYCAPLQHTNCPLAQRFFERAIKIFVPVRTEDHDSFMCYLEGFKKAAEHFS